MSTSVFDIRLISSYDEATKVSQEIKEAYAGPVGFDTETELTNNRRVSQVSTIQLYVPWTHRKPVCYIFHVGLWDIRRREDVPVGLRQILTCKTILKACAAPENDVNWIRSDFGITMAGYVDIQTYAAIEGHEKLGLDSLAQELLPQWTGKSKDMHTMRWNLPLTKEMIEYAANDAYASLELLRILAPQFFKPMKEIRDKNLATKVWSLMKKNPDKPDDFVSVVKHCDHFFRPLIKHVGERRCLSCLVASEICQRAGIRMAA